MIIPFNPGEKVGQYSGNISGNVVFGCLITLNEQELGELRVNGGWLSVSQFAQWSGNPERTIKDRLKKQKYANLQRVDESDRRRPYQINFTALPDQAREAFVRQIRGIKPMTPEEIEERNRAFRARTATAGHNQKKAYTRHSILKLYRQFIAGDRGGLIDRKAAFCERYNRGGFLELEDERKAIASVSWKTLDRWQKDLDAAEGDPLGVAPKYGTSKGLVMVSMAEGEALLKYALFANKLTYAEIIDYAKKDLKNAGYPARCSDETMYRYLRKHLVNNGYIHDTMRDGEKALNDRYLPSIERDRNKIEVGDKLVADGHTFNFTMLDPISGRPKRMTLVMVFDFRSGMPVGWDFAPSENTAVIASAYRRAIKTLGFVPRLFYVDNGRAFTGKYFTKVPDAARNVVQEKDLSGLFSRLKPYGFIECVNALPYHGQSKPIERYFGTMHSFEKRLPTYVGNSIENRVASERRNEKLHRDLRERMTGGAQPTVTEVNALLIEWVMEYAQKPASKSAFYPGRTPLEVYEESIERVRITEGFENRQIAEHDLLWLMMGEVKRSARNSKIKLFGRHFYAPELFGYRPGEKDFVVKYDLLDEDGVHQVYVFDESGQELICTAQDDFMTGIHPAARTLGSAEDQRRLGEAIDEQSAIKKAAKSIAKSFIGKGYYDAIAAEEARVVPSMRQIEDRQRMVVEKTGTDGGRSRQAELEALNEKIMARKLARYREEDEW